MSGFVVVSESRHALFIACLLSSCFLICSAMHVHLKGETDMDNTFTSTPIMFDITPEVDSRNGTQKAVSFTKLVDDYTLDIFIVVQYCVISTLVNIFGIATNIINIFVFIKQGFSDSINISLFGLAISDLGSMVFLEWANICFSPALHYSEAPFSSMEIQYLTAGWPRMTLLRITGWITAFITFERCLCIVIPLKIKTLITPRRTVFIIASIYFVVFACHAPIYYTSRLVWKFFPERNRTLLGLGFVENRPTLDIVLFVVNNVFLTIVAFLIVVVCTIILIVGLNSKAKWREKSASRADQIASKDKKIVKMITTISAVFIICFFPNSVVFIAMSVVPEFNIDGKYRNIFILSFSFCFLLESISSSINIFLYYRMSSKFRESFNFVRARIMCARLRGRSIL